MFESVALYVTIIPESLVHELEGGDNTAPPPDLGPRRLLAMLVHAAIAAMLSYTPALRPVTLRAYAHASPVVMQVVQTSSAPRRPAT